MPKIPIYTAQGVRVRPRSPDYIYGVSSAGLDVGTSLAKLAIEFTREGARQVAIQDKLQKQQDDLDIATLTNQFDAGMAATRVELTQNTDYRQHERTFVDKATELARSLRERVATPEVEAGLYKHIVSTLPIQAIQVRANANKLWLDKQQADLLSVGDISAERAIRTPLTYDPTVSTETGQPIGFTSSVRDIERATYKSLVDKWFANGAINAEQQRLYKSSYDEKVLKGSMQRLQELGKTDSSARDQLFDLDRKGAWNELPSVERLKILNQSLADAREEEKRNDQAMTKLKGVALEGARSQALNGALSESRLEDIKNNKDPFVDPNHYPQLKEWNENPPGAKGNQEAMAVMAEYEGGPRTQERLLKARNDLNRIQSTLNRANPYIVKELGRIQEHENGLKVQARIGLHEDLKFFNDSYDAIVPPPRMFELPGMKNIREADIKRLRNEMEADIRSGKRTVEDAMKYAKDYIDTKYIRRQPGPGNLTSGDKSGTQTAPSKSSSRVQELLR